jgi:hypothetical protein
MDEVDELALALAQRSIDEVSPAERPVIDALGPDLLAAGGEPARDGALGFGVGEVALSVAAVGAAKAAAEVVVQILRAVAVEEGKGIVRWLIERLRGDSTAAPAGEALAASDLTRVRDVAFRHAAAIGVDEARAATLADAIVGSLAAATAAG